MIKNPADLVADYIEPAKPQGHPHAESMRLYAEDAAECVEPWTRWEVCLSGGWEELTVQPSWAPHFQYRRKPKTVRIGEFDVPPPMREAPPVGTVVFVVTLMSLCAHAGFLWTDSEINKRSLKRGLLHRTHEAADLHAKALISLTEAHNG